ncbi:ATP-binding protein [Seohaeicola sp. SP36]|uniref:ATP-binding protein n=1 Tax=Seohaeicola sp. SP36 TaxID=3028380 RepID=UPI00237C1875|nr:ATP-binding protein [Seohaeicola sp. SP36]MDD9738013.1 ATP-binding protein [Seohaeicola sp. SP36]
MADRRAVFSVVQNLFNNAIKFTDNGSAEIELSTDAYGSVQIKVKDTGIGIEDQSLATIFEEFQQANPRIARQHGGTGLGMAIVKRLIEAMDGEIKVQSELGKGTTFTVSLPLEAIAPVSSQADTRAG